MSYVYLAHSRMSRICPVEETHIQKYRGSILERGKTLGKSSLCGCRIEHLGGFSGERLTGQIGMVLIVKDLEKDIFL